MGKDEEYNIHDLRAQHAASVVQAQAQVPVKGPEPVVSKSKQDWNTWLACAAVFVACWWVSSSRQTPEAAAYPQEAPQASQTAWVQPHWWSPIADVEDYGNVYPVQMQPGRPPVQQFDNRREEMVKREQEMVKQLRLEREKLQAELERLKEQKVLREPNPDW